MTANYSTAVSTARDYYNSEDADSFYSIIWGGEDIHIGWYESPTESIDVASRRTVERMANRLARQLGPSSRALDLGSGYGGAARYLANRFGCQIVALNLSEAENARARELNTRQSLEHLVEVVDGSFESIPAADECFDVVWSQDAILHSGNRSRVIAEVARVLKPGGSFLFTDPMQADDCPSGVLEPILSRIHLETLGSPRFYETECARAGLELTAFNQQTRHLVQHYRRVLQETEARQEELRGVISDAYIEKMKAGLGHWIEGGRQAYLTWGIFHFCKPLPPPTT